MRRIIAVVAVTAALIAQPYGVTGAGAANHASTESDFVQLMNEERVERGLGRLSVSADLRQYARDHSAVMDDEDNLHHSSDLRTLTNWQMLGENVGRGGSVQALHDAFMDSPGHRDNVLRENFSQVGVGVVIDDDVIWVTVVFREPDEMTETASPAPAAASPTSTGAGDQSVTAVMAHASGDGYYVVRRNGDVVPFGDVPFFGDAEDTSHGGIVDAVAHPAGTGYWLISARGGVYTYGDAGFHGSAANLPIVGQIVTAMVHPSGQGYYLITDRGAVYAFGRAPFHGAATDIPNSGIVDAVYSPEGRGYWLFSTRGGVYTFGNIGFHGSAASIPIVGEINNALPHPSGKGYWLLTDRGGVYTFGNIPFFGAATDLSPEPFVDGVADPQGDGNWLVTTAGSVYGFGDVSDFGSL